MPKLTKPESEWRRELTPEQYAVTRQGATEAPFSGIYWNEHAAGTYLCVCCGARLFTSGAKFDSGCGWPSYSAAAGPEAVTELPDNSHSMLRTEVRCAVCGAHLGHVFDDGPGPTFLRYCINSAALRLDR
jgi:peptide-methionine (R)-S-oxide reductase